MKCLDLACAQRFVIRQETILKLTFNLLNTHKDYTPTHAQVDSYMCTTIHTMQTHICIGVSVKAEISLSYMKFHVTRLAVLNVFP